MRACVRACVACERGEKASEREGVCVYVSKQVPQRMRCHEVVHAVAAAGRTDTPGP